MSSRASRSVTSTFGIQGKYTLTREDLEHCGPDMSDIFFRDPGMPAPDRRLDVGSGSHAEQTAKIMVAFEKGGRPRARRIGMHR